MQTLGRSDCLEGSHRSTNWCPVAVLRLVAGRLFSERLWESWVFVCKRMKPDLDLTSYRDHPQMD